MGTVYWQQGSPEACPTILTRSPNWYKAHLINVSESINQVNYCRTLTLIPLNPALDNNQLKKKEKRKEEKKGQKTNDP